MDQLREDWLREWMHHWWLEVEAREAFLKPNHWAMVATTMLSMIIEASSEDSEEREALAQHVGAILSMMVNDKFDTTEMH